MKEILSDDEKQQKSQMEVQMASRALKVREVNLSLRRQISRTLGMKMSRL